MLSVMWYYLCFINVFAFVLYGIDKRRARTNQWRISEKNLLGLAWLGGAIGAVCGMYLFRHKTRHVRFRVQVPLALALWCLGVGWAIFRFYR